jgi:hypothetical protein
MAGSSRAMTRAPWVETYARGYQTACEHRNVSFTANIRLNSTKEFNSVYR